MTVPSDSLHKQRFAVVPMWVHRRILETGTRTMALAVYVELVGRYAGTTQDAEGLRVWPQVQQIADSMGVPKRNVERALTVLVDCGAVLKKRTVRRNQYWLPQEPPEEFAATLKDFQSATSGGLDRVQSATSDGLDNVQSATSGGPRSATSGGFQSATSGGLYKPDPITQTQETLSPPAAPTEPAAAGSRPGERETKAAPTSNALTTAQRIIRASRVLGNGEDEAAFIAWATARHSPRSPAWWRTLAANGDLPELVAAWRGERAPQTSGAPAASGPGGLPPWCGRCGDADQYAVGDLVPPAKNNPLFRKVTDPATGEEVPCPDCHPSAVAAEAA